MPKQTRETNIEGRGKQCTVLETMTTHSALYLLYFAVILKLCCTIYFPNTILNSHFSSKLLLHFRTSTFKIVRFQRLHLSRQQRLSLKLGVVLYENWWLYESRKDMLTQGVPHREIST